MSATKLEGRFSSLQAALLVLVTCSILNVGEFFLLMGEGSCYLFILFIHLHMQYLIYYVFTWRRRQDSKTSIIKGVAVFQPKKKGIPLSVRLSSSSEELPDSR